MSTQLRSVPWMCGWLLRECQDVEFSEGWLYGVSGRLRVKLRGTLVLCLWSPGCDIYLLGRTILEFGSKSRHLARSSRYGT